MAAASDPHEKLSWELIDLLFEPEGRSRIVSKLGFSSQKIIQEAERSARGLYTVGQKRGSGRFKTGNVSAVQVERYRTKAPTAEALCPRINLLQF